MTAYHAEMADFPGTTWIQINFHALCCFEYYKKNKFVGVFQTGIFISGFDQDITHKAWKFTWTQSSYPTVSLYIIVSSHPQHWFMYIRVLHPDVEDV